MSPYFGTHLLLPAKQKGILVESQGPTWFYGTASEHAVLYQYNIASAQNIYMGMVHFPSFSRPSPHITNSHRSKPKARTTHPLSLHPRLSPPLSRSSPTTPHFQIAAVASPVLQPGLSPSLIQTTSKSPAPVSIPSSRTTTLHVSQHKTASNVSSARIRMAQCIYLMFLPSEVLGWSILLSRPSTGSQVLLWRWRWRRLIQLIVRRLMWRLSMLGLRFSRDGKLTFAIWKQVC